MRRADGCWRRRVERSRSRRQERDGVGSASPSPCRRDALDPLIVGERCDVGPEELVAALERRARSSDRPMLAPSFSTSTCIATIPASITPSSGIHARPRTIRSSSEWSERAENAAGAPRSKLRVSGASARIEDAAVPRDLFGARRPGRRGVAGVRGSAARAVRGGRALRRSGLSGFRGFRALGVSWVLGVATAGGPEFRRGTCRLSLRRCPRSSPCAAANRRRRSGALRSGAPRWRSRFGRPRSRQVASWR